MVRLRQLLADSSKARRHRRNILNIQITILAWLVEFFGFFTIFLGSFILGHQNSIITMSLQTLTDFLYFIILPCILLINDPDFKTNIVESSCYTKLLNLFHCQYTNQLDEDNDNSGVNNRIEEADDHEHVNIPIEEDGDNEDGNVTTDDSNNEIASIQIQKNDGYENINEGVIEGRDRQNCNLPVVIHRIVPFSNDCEIIDLESNQEL